MTESDDSVSRSSLSEVDIKKHSDKISSSNQQLSSSTKKHMPFQKTTRIGGGMLQSASLELETPLSMKLGRGPCGDKESEPNFMRSNLRKASNL